MEKRVVSRQFVVSVFLLVGIAACGGTASLLEEARFALDSCNPSKQSDQAVVDACKAALAKAEEVLASDATNVEAALIKSSAKVGLAGFDFLQFAATLVDLESKKDTTDQFKQFQNKIKSVETENGKAIGLSELNEAIEVLNTVLSGKTADDSNKKAFFQLGALRAIDTFVRPAKLVTFAADGTINATAITTEQFKIVDASARGADNNLTAGGLSNEDTLKASREAFCRCDINAKAVGGWTQTCLKDVMRCNLSDKKTEPLDQDYNGNGASGTSASREADCAKLNTKSDALTKCKSSEI